MCFGTRSGTAIKRVFQKSLRARLKERRSGPQLEETLIDPLFTDVAFRRNSEGDGSGHYESGGVMSPPSPVPSAPLDEGTANSVARVVAVTQVGVGYFENTVAGKITEPRVAFFWATFIIYRGRPKCI